VSETPPQPAGARLVFAGLRLPGLAALVLGIFALLVPGWFHDTFPLGRGWLRDDPYSEHMLRDVGGLYLGAAVLMLGLPVRCPTRARRLVLVSWLVSAVPHTVYHVVVHSTLPTGDRITEVGLLAVLIAVPSQRRSSGMSGPPPVRHRRTDAPTTDSRTDCSRIAVAVIGCGSLYVPRAGLCTWTGTSAASTQSGRVVESVRSGVPTPCRRWATRRRPDVRVHPGTASWDE
jgi:hypothetical protein